MKKSQALMALVLALLLMAMSLAAEAAVRLVDRDGGRRNQANIDSAGIDDGEYCLSCNGTEEDDDSGNTIIFE